MGVEQVMRSVAPAGLRQLDDIDQQFRESVAVMAPSAPRSISKSRNIRRCDEIDIGFSEPSFW